MFHGGNGKREQTVRVIFDQAGRFRFRQFCRLNYTPLAQKISSNFHRVDFCVCCGPPKTLNPMENKPAFIEEVRPLNTQKTNPLL